MKFPPTAITRSLLSHSRVKKGHHTVKSIRHCETNFCHMSHQISLCSLLCQHRNQLSICEQISFYSDYLKGLNGFQEMQSSECSFAFRWIKNTTVSSAGSLNSQTLFGSFPRTLPKETLPGVGHGTWARAEKRLRVQAILRAAIFDILISNEALTSH